MRRARSAAHILAGWFNPFALNTTELVGGVLLGMFIYWGWDSGVAVNEESENPAEGPGRAAVLSTILLVLISLLVATAAQADAVPAIEHDALEIMKRWDALRTSDLPALNRELRPANLPEVQIDSNPHAEETGMDED